MAVLINFKICDNAEECSGIEVCPTKALYWDENNKTIAINNSKCNNCKLCEKACPVEAIKVAMNDEEFEKIKEEIDKDQRKISDLFVDRYGAQPIDPDTLIKTKDFRQIFKLNKPILIEFFEDDSIECLKRSIPIRELIKHQDIIFRKIKINDQLLKEFGIKKLPALLLFKDKKFVGKIEGYFDREKGKIIKKKVEELLNKDIKLEEVWKKLKVYFNVEKVLEIGVGFQDCPKVILDNAKQIDRISINKELLEIGKKKYPHLHVNYKLMSAEKLDYSDGYFDTIFISSSYHEFDPKIQKKALEEMYRTLKEKGVWVFIEPEESSITNELFTVFDPKENHAQRISNSFKILNKFIKSKQMEIILNGETKVIDKFKTREEYNQTMLEWWSDIKVPSDKKEKKDMIKKINEILSKANMLEGLEISEDSMFLVIRKNNIQNL